jgi:hypothetical protein
MDQNQVRQMKLANELKRVLSEGLSKKGVVLTAPTTPRPPAPQAQSKAEAGSPAIQKVGN